MTLVCEASFPLMSVIWYFGFEFFKRTMPGVTSGSGVFFLPDDGELLFLLDFWIDEASSSYASKGVEGCNWLAELIMLSQMTACEGGAVEEDGG